MGKGSDPVRITLSGSAAHPRMTWVYCVPGYRGPGLLRRQDLRPMPRAMGGAMIGVCLPGNLCS